MICNVDGTWELEPSDIRTYNVVVAKLLQEKAMSNDKTMNVDKFVRYMYKEMLDGLEDEQKALAFTRHTPSAMLLTGTADLKTREALKAKGYKTEDVENLETMFAASLQAVSNFVTPKADSTAGQVAAQVKAATTAASLQPTPKEKPTQTGEKTARKDKDFDLPDNPLSTTGNEQIPGREWYYGFIKKLSVIMEKVNGVSNKGTVGMPGVDGGVRITMVLGIPKNQLYADDQAMSDADIERYTSQTMYSVVTNAAGDFIYFNENYEVTTEDAGGKLIYFPTRTIPTSTVNKETGERQFNLNEQTGKSIQSIADRSRKGDTVESVTKQYNAAYNSLYEMKKHLMENPGSKLLLDIAGIDTGTINYDKDAQVSLRTVKNIEGFTATVTGPKNRNYLSIRLTNGASVPMIMRAYGSTLATKVAEFITSKVYDTAGNLLTPLDKLNSLKTFTRTSGQGKLAIDEANGFVILGEEVVMMDDPEIKSKIVNFLTRQDEITREDGTVTKYDNQLYFNQDVYEKNQTVDEFELIPTSDGFQYNSNPKVYNEWIRDNAYLPVVLDNNGNIRELNGYFKFTPNSSAIETMQPKVESSEQATEITAETTKVTIDSVSMANFQPTSDIIAEAAKAGIFSPDKLFSMRDDNVSATNAQVRRGKKWYDKTELKFKDANGKLVTKKLTDVLPYETLFNVVNSNGKVRAQFTKSGVTLFNGSDYTALYHEAWHGFTQLFLSPEQRQKLYNEVKSLGKPIKYYNKDKDAWESMNSADLDFSNVNHILYAEEFLADEYREYAKNRSAKTATFKNIFKKIWEAIKALFGKSTKSSITNTIDNPVLKEAFNELYVGDLSNYTYNQDNIQFDTLNSGINFLTPVEGKPNTMDIADSLDMAETMNYFVSQFIDEVNSKYKTSAFTINTLINPEYKKLALKHALTNFKAYANNLANTIKGLDEGYVKLKLEKQLAVWQNTIDNFGDVEDLSNNKDKGAIAFYNKRTGFLNITGSVTQKDAVDETDEDTTEDGEMSSKSTDKSGVGATDGTESSSFDRIDEAVLFTMSSLYDRTDTTDKNKEGYIFNAAGGIATANPRKVFNIISAETEGIKDRTEMYNALALASKALNKNGEIKPEGKIIEQFLSKIGKPGSGRMGSEMLWNQLYRSLRYDRIRGKKMLATRTVDADYNTGDPITNVLMTVSVPDSGYKAVQRKFEDSFQSMHKNKSPFKVKTSSGEIILDLDKLAAKYYDADYREQENIIARVNPIEFFNDFGIPITDNYKSVQKLNAKKIVSTIFKFRLRELLAKKNETIKSIKSLIGNQDRQYDELAKIESEANYNFSDYMIKNAEEELQSERSNPSAAGSVITDLNAFDDYDNLIVNPATSHFDKNRNSFVKTSLIFKRLFGDNLKKKKIHKNGQKATLELTNLLGTQVLEETAFGKKLLEGVKSSDSSEETAYMRDLFFYTLDGASEAFRHADKSMSYVAKLEGDPTVRFYIHPKLFTESNSEFQNNGVKEANKVMYGYIASELERIKRVKNGVYATGEKPSDIILYAKKTGGYFTYADTGSTFTVFDEILSDELKNKLINDTSINTVEDLLAKVDSDISLRQSIDKNLNDYFTKEFAKDKAKFDSFGLTADSTELKALRRTLGYSIPNSVLYTSAIQSFTYASFIHKFEMNTLIYGDPATYNLPKDEHMKRIAAFFAAGPIPVTDQSTEDFLKANPGGYANSKYYKESNLAVPSPGMQERRILDTSVLEDAIEESAYYQTMVDYAVNVAKWDKKEAESRYKAYKDMKSADAQAWITFDAYRALEHRLGNWGPIKEQLYWDILNGKDVSLEKIDQFFPVKKYQYAGAISTSNFAVNGFHKYSVMPLIPTVIKGRRLEALHNKMISQGIAYSVMHSGSKLASIGKEGNLSLFYTKQKGDNTAAFTDPNYQFNKTPIFLEYLKQQVSTSDSYKGYIKFPSQIRKLITSGLMELGVPYEYMSKSTPDERRIAWAKEKNKLQYPSYRLQQAYNEGIAKMVTVAENQLKRELGYDNGQISVKKLIDFVKNNLKKRDVSEYDLEFIKLSDDGKLLLPLDLSNDPSKIEKLITSVVNKRIVDQISAGEQYVQGSGIGFEKYSKPTENQLAKYSGVNQYGTNGLRFYEPVYDDKGNVLYVTPMEVKISLHGDFKKLLQHRDTKGKIIGTLARLNQLIKDEEWLSQGDNRRMITLTGVRIPTQGANSMEAIQVAEFLPEIAGNIMIVPSDIVAKSGGDFDIDKLVTLIPPIDFNNGRVELKTYTETTKSLEEIAVEKKALREELKNLRENVKDPIYSKAFAEMKSSNGDNKLFILKSELTPELMAELTPNDKDGNRVKGGEYYGIKILGDFYSHDVLTSDTGDNLDIIVVDNVEDAEKQYQAYLAGGAKNFTGVSEIKTVNKRKSEKASRDYFKAIGEVRNKLRELQKEENSFQADAYQNNLMKSMIDILLRPDNYLNLTLPNDTDLFEGTNGPVETFKDINKPIPESQSPTRIMKNSYNIEKAIAMAVGKAGIGMLATGNTFFEMYKNVGLTMNARAHVRNKKSKTGFSEIPQRLLLNHNNINGEISLSHTKDASGKHDIAELISQLMNGYLDVAKKTWAIDINASKEFEPQLEFMLLAGVPVMDSIAMLSQPWVREYLEYIKKFSDPQQIAKGNIDNVKQAAYNAAKEVFTKHGISGVGSTAKMLEHADAELIHSDIISFEELKKGALGKQNESFNRRMFLHFLEITNMSKGNTELKRTLNFDTDKKQSLFEISQKESNLRAMSDQFSKESIHKLINNTILKNFRTYAITEAAVSSLLPLRGIRTVNTYLADQVSKLDLDFNGKQRYYNGFINDLTSYLYRNYTTTFDKNDNEYRGATIDSKIPIKQQPLLKFGAYPSNDGSTLYVDNNSIANDFEKGNYAKADYGKGELAPLPEGAFMGYPKDKGLDLYTNFVYEREFLRVQYPYSTITKNKEFRLFATRRIKFFPETEREDNTRLPQMWEEFLRNKAMANVRLDEGLFSTNYTKGTVSKAQQLFDLMERHPDLERLYPVLGELKITKVEAKEFITLRSKLKDADLSTSYASQLSKLMDLGETKAENKEDSDMITEFFRGLPLVAFQQAGNNAKSELYIGNLFDQNMTGIPEFLQEPLGKFIKDLNGPNAINILNAYSTKYRFKGVLKQKYVNYTASPTFAVSDEATDPKTTVGHSGGAAGADTKWDEIGQEFGPIKFKHYYTGERSENNAPLGNVDITDKPIAVEGASKVAQAAAQIWGYGYQTMKDQRLIRNWAQVANSDAIYAIAPIGKAGDYWSEDMGKSVQSRRVLLKDAVQGGTGYAVEMAIQANKPVYVYNDPNDKAQSHLPKGWYTWQGGKFVSIDTPALSKNFAGIGSRGMSEEAEQAIRDVYTKAFGTPGGKDSIVSQVEGPGPETKINIYAGTGENAELSNFAVRPFMHLGINFDSVEQAFQYYKTEFSPKNDNNRAVASVIKDTKDGKRLRELGKEFKGLDQKVWDSTSPTIMKALLKDSFQQNPEALAKLLATGNATLTHTQDKGKWGTEFPKLLMEVRNELRPKQTQEGVKEGVQELFDSNPELAKIGTAVQYSKYLKTVFPSSTVKDILYHGTYQDFDQFSKEKLGNTTGLGKITDNKRGETFDYDSANAFFFTDNKTNAISYALLGRGNYLGSIETALSRLTFTRKDAQESIDFLKTVPYFNNLIETAKAEGKTKEEILDLLKEERRKLAGKYKSRDAQGFTNTINNVKLANEVLTRFLSQIDKFKANDPSIEGMYGTFEEYNDGNATGTHRIYYKPNEGGYEFVNFEKGISGASRRFVSSMSKSDIKKFLEDAIEADNKVLAENEKEMKRKGYKKKTIPVLLNLKNPLVHDYEGSSFPDSYKETKYPTSYIAARQVASALKEGKDGVVYENITDPLRSNSYGIFEPEQIHILGNKQDLEGFKNFVSTGVNENVNEEYEETQDNTVKVQNSLVRGFDYVTGKPLDPALIYDDTKVLTADAVKGVAENNPDSLFVFEDQWPTASGARNTLPDRGRRVWAQFAPQGISFGLSTVKNRDFQSLDSNYDKLVPIIDAQIEALREKRDQGKKIVFPENGIGQNLMGVKYENGEWVSNKELPAPNLFIYLSKRLLQDFGYQNPIFDVLRVEKSKFDPALIGGNKTTSDYLQEYYKEKGLQQITDSDIILEKQKNCKK